MCVDLGLAFGLLTNIKMNLNTESHDKRPVYFNAESLYLSSPCLQHQLQTQCRTFFFCLSHALSCMLLHANRLPCHCSLLELKIKEFQPEDA